MTESVKLSTISKQFYMSAGQIRQKRCLYKDRFCMVWYGKECADGILYSFICFSSGTGGRDDPCGSGCK